MTATKERLVAELRKLAEQDMPSGQQARLVRMIQAAERGIYDDYESPLATPLNALVEDLGSLSLPEAESLIERVKAGEFDGTKEEADAWARSPEGRRTFDSLITREDAPR